MIWQGAGVGLIAIASLSVALLAFDFSGQGTAAVAHTPFHFACRNHNHGPKWHDDHGRMLRRSGTGDLAGRGMTAGRRPDGARQEN